MLQIEAGFPLQVCVSCVGKLNVCYELVQLSEKAYEKLVSLRGEWEAKKLVRGPNSPFSEYGKILVYSNIFTEGMFYSYFRLM